MNISIMTGIRKIYPTQAIALTNRQQALFDKIKLDGSITMANAVYFTQSTYKKVRNDLALLKLRELVSVKRIGSRNVFSAV